MSKDWKVESTGKLTEIEKEVIWNKGTEPAYKGKYDKFYPKIGYFACKVCSSPIYSASSKFDSGCGWPAFDKCYEGSIKTITDNSFGMKRVEIMCGNCGGHLGHVFHGEFKNETNERHCVNSVSLSYIESNPPSIKEAPLGMDEETAAKVESIRQYLELKKNIK